MDADQPAHPRSLIRIHAVRLQTLLQVENQESALYLDFEGITVFFYLSLLIIFKNIITYSLNSSLIYFMKEKRDETHDIELI
jgi:hypothetical protein